MATKSLVACNACGTIAEIDNSETLAEWIGWIEVKARWRSPLDGRAQDDKWLACSPGCLAELGKMIEAERGAELR